MTDGIKLKGIFTLKIFEGGELREEFVGNNLVVDLGRASLMALLGAGGTDRVITKIQFGTSGTPQTVADEAITSPFTKAIESVDYPEPNSVLFNFELETSEDNGVTIREFGLCSDDGTLFARITREGVDKTSALRFEGTWKIIC